MNTSKNLIAIHFSAYSVTNYGETIVITGNCSELGLWNPMKGLKLLTNSKQYPIWFSKKPITLQKLSNLEYKLCILDKEGNIARWENLKQNRNLSLKTSCSIFLTQGQYQAQYDFDNSDAASTHSTQINSTKKTALSQIEQQSDDDQPHQHRQRPKYNVFGQQRKRSGSSITRKQGEAIMGLLDETQLIKSQTNIN